jgi:hypothetical protein
MKQWVDKYKSKTKYIKDNIEFIFDERDYDIDKECDAAYHRILDNIIVSSYYFLFINFVIGFFALYRDYVQTLF